MGAGSSTEENEFFTQPEKDQLSPALRDKIEKHFLDERQCIEDLETKYERLRVDSEQRYFELERNLVDSQGKLTAETATSSQLKDQLDDLEKKYNDTAQKFRDLQERDFTSSKQMDDVHRIKHQLEGEKHDLTEIVEKKNKEIDRLTADWKAMCMKVNDANKEKIEALTKADDAKSLSISSQHQITRLNQEKDRLLQEKQWLDRAVNEKTNELLAFRKQNSSKSLELQAHLDEKTEELRHERDLHESQKDRNERLQAQIETYIEKLKEQKEFQAQSEEQYRNENHAQEKLIQLYKNSSDEGDAHVKELTTAVEELQGMLKQATKATSELEELRKEDATKYEEILLINEQAIEKLKRENQDANDLLQTARQKGVAMLSDESLDILSPSAAAASRLLKSGMTLTQIYSEYVQASENLHLEKDENTRLNQYLDQILQEIEEKAPIMQKQREDYEKCLETIDQMTRQLDSAMLESENLRIHAEDTNRRNGEISRENFRFKRQSHDLTAQVRMLIKELSEARGNLVHVDDLSTSREGSTSGLLTPGQQVITENLVTFRGIEELQEQNQKLLGIVRDLTDRQEEEESLALDSKTIKLNERLQQAAEEIEELKASRDRQEKMVESIVRQRDMFKVLLSQTTGNQMPIMQPSETSTPAPGTKESKLPITPKTPTHPPQSPSISMRVFEETKKALTELQDEFQMYRREKGENEKLVSVQLDKFRNESSELKMLNAKISSQLDYSSERYKVLQSNIEGYKKEIASLTEKNTRFTTNIVKHEEKQSAIREEMMVLQGKLTKAEVSVEHLRSQNETLRNIETRLMQEKESSMRENRTSQLLMANLQAIQNNLERSEFETKTAFRNQIDQLERDNVQLKRKLDGGHEHQRNIIQSLEKQLTQARELLGQEDQSHRDAQNQVKAQKIEIDTVNSKLKQVETQLKSTQDRLLAASKAQSHHQPIPSETNHALEEEIKDLKNNIKNSNEEIKSLKDKWNKAQQHVQQFKNIANTMETNMADQTKTSKEFQEKMEEEVKATKQALKETKALLQNVEKEKERLLEENIKISNEISSSNTDLRTQLKTLQTELETAVARREQAIQNEQTAKQDMLEQLNRANEASDKYEREFMFHAADMTSLQAAKKELEGFQDKIRKSEEAAKEAQDKLAFEKHSWIERENLLKTDRKQLQDRIDEILEQNSMLHDNVEQLSDQMVNIQKRKDSEDKETADMAEKFTKDPGEKTLEQLNEVIKYLRKENTISVTRMSVIEAETNRYKQQAQFFQKQLEDSQKSLNEERQTAQVTIQTAAEHADLLRKVENLNVFQDSNRLLREEKDKLNNKFKELEARASELSTAIEPLQGSIRLVSAERDTLQAESQAQKEEINSWKTRANHLIEQCNKFDPEEFKQAVKDRDELKKANNTLHSEINQQKAEAVNLKMQLSNLKNEESAAKNKVIEANAEKDKLTKTVESQKLELEKNEKTIVQLKNLGRKYKKEVEDNRKEIETLKKSKELQVNIPDLQSKLKASEDQVKDTDEKLKKAEKATEEQKKALELQIKTLEEKVKVKEIEIQGFEEKLKTTEECIKVSEVKRKAIEERLKVAEDKQKVAEASQKLADDKVKTLEKQSTTATTTLNTNAQKVEQTEKEKNDALNKLTASETKLKANETAMKQLNEEVAQFKEAKEALEKAKSEVEADRDKVKRLNTMAKGKLVQQKKEIESLTNEKNSLKNTSTSAATEQAQRLKLMQSQVERQRVELEAARQSAQELESIKQELESLKKEHAELKHKQAKLLERQIQSPPGSQSQTTVDPSKTANIRPMTAPSSSPQVRLAQATPIQQVRSTSVAETRAMASIRPMAVSPATSSTPSVTQSSQQQAQTPTATVHPTTQEGGEAMMSPLQVTTTQGRPTQSVQPVSPHVEDLGASETPTAPQEVSSSSTPSSSIHPSSSTSTASTTTATIQPQHITIDVGGSSSGSSSGIGGPTTSSSVTGSIATSSASTSSSLFAPVFGMSGASSIGSTHLSGSSGGGGGGSSSTSSGIFGGAKRQREEDDEANRSASQPEGPLKKSKTMGAEAASAQDASSGPSTTTEGGPSQDWNPAAGVSREVNIAHVGPEPVQSTQKLSAAVEPTQEQLPEFIDTEDDEPDEEQGFQSQHRHREAEQTPDDVIVVDFSESIDPGEEYGPGEYDVEYEEGDMEEEYEDEGIEGQAEEGSQEDDDDVVIVEDEDEEDMNHGQGGTSTSISVAPQSSVPVTPQAAGIETQISIGSVGSSQGSDPGRLLPTSQIGRVPATSGRAQLAPFVFGGEPGAEFGDDGIVPSTPTLFVPRRNDGFAEAISSPLVSRQFVFGGQSDLSSGPDFGQLSSEGMDAPYIDFAQFGEDGSQASQPIQQLVGGFPRASASNTTPPQQVISSTVTIEVTEAQDEAERIDSSTGISHEADVSSGDVANSTKPSATEVTSSDVVQQKETPSTSTGAGDTQDKPDGGKRKIEPIVWDKPSASGISPRPSGSTPARGQAFQQQQQQQQQQPPSLLQGTSILQGQSIGTVGTGQNLLQQQAAHQQKSFTSRGAQQKTFRTRGSVGRGTAVRARPFQQQRGGSLRGAHSLGGASAGGQQQGGIQQRGGQRGGRFHRGNTRGQFRGGHPF